MSALLISDSTVILATPTKAVATSTIATEVAVVTTKPTAAQPNVANSRRRRQRSSTVAWPLAGSANESAALMGNAPHSERDQVRNVIHELPSRLFRRKDGLGLYGQVTVALVAAQRPGGTTCSSMYTEAERTGRLFGHATQNPLRPRLASLAYRESGLT